MLLLCKSIEVKVRGLLIKPRLLVSWSEAVFKIQRPRLIAQSSLPTLLKDRVLKEIVQPLFFLQTVLFL
jgi:hypothetical protein